MALSRVQYTGNGTGIYNVPFPYLSQAYVKVYVAGVLKTLDVDYSFNSASSIQFVTDPTGLLIEIRRETPDATRLVDFQDGAILNEAGLDMSADQAFHVVQEVKDDMDSKVGGDADGTVDAGSRRIKNVADPVNAQDAATKSWVESSTAASVAAAASSATSAGNSATAAGTHAANAGNAATAAAASAVAADASADSAAVSAAAAAASAAAVNPAELLTKSGNLAGLADVPTARTNLGLGSAATKTAGTGAGQVPLVENILGKHTVGIPAGAMKPRLTAGASAAAIALGTNGTIVVSLDFDATTVQYAQFSIPAPKGIDSSAALVGFFEWSHPATTTNFGVAWAVRAKFVRDDDPLDGEWSAWVQVNDVGGTTDDLYVSALSAGLAPAGTYAENCTIMFEVKRVADDATNDTLAVKARLKAFNFKYTTAALNDA